MMYDSNIKTTMLSTLDNRMLSISDVILALFNEGYIPNRKKYVLLNLIDVVYRGIYNIDCFNEETRENFEKLYAKIV